MGESKAAVGQALAVREGELVAAQERDRLAEEALDLTGVGIRRSPGSRHPLSVLMENMADVFVAMGWEIAKGPSSSTNGSISMP